MRTPSKIAMSFTLLMFFLLGAFLLPFIAQGCVILHFVRLLAKSHQKSVEIENKNADDYYRILSITVSDLASGYRTGSSIPVIVRITNHGPWRSSRNIKRGHPTAQLFPHLNLWVERDSKFESERIVLPIENRITIKKGETFEYTVDLGSSNLLATPGEYSVSLGHWNFKITDPEDWMGKLRSRSQSIKIMEK